jgi:hypothetical protein
VLRGSRSDPAGLASLQARRLLSHRPPVHPSPRPCTCSSAPLLHARFFLSHCSVRAEGRVRVWDVLPTFPHGKRVALTLSEMG